MNRQKVGYCNLLLCILLFSACQSQLPEDVPNNFEVRYDDLRNELLYPGGPPSGFFKRITVTRNRATIEFSRCEKVETIILSERETRGFYEFFLEAEFDLIENAQSPKSASDEEGFKEIYLRAGNISKSIKQGKSFPLSAKNNQRFNGLWTRITDLVYPKATHC